MKTLILSMAALLAATHPIDQAAKGLKIQAEDDLQSGKDDWLKVVKSKPCVTTLIGKTQSWTLDWSKIYTAGLVENFIYLEGQGVKMALVANVNTAAKLKKLQALAQAMQNEQARCGGADIEPPELGQ